MGRLVVLMAVALAYAVPAFPACTPKQGPKGSPRVCITRDTSGKETEFIASPNSVKVATGQRVTFKFADGKGKLKIVFEAGTKVSDEKKPDDATVSVLADTVAGPEEYKYTIIDEVTGDETDPTIIIEPAAPPPPPAKGRKRLPKE